MVRGFDDYWVRAGLPANERLHSVFTWNEAINRACERLAQRTGLPVEQLKAETADLRGAQRDSDRVTRKASAPRG